MMVLPDSLLLPSLVRFSLPALLLSILWLLLMVGLDVESITEVWPPTWRPTLVSSLGSGRPIPSPPPELAMIAKSPSTWDEEIWDVHVHRKSGNDFENLGLFLSFLYSFIAFCFPGFFAFLHVVCLSKARSASIASVHYSFLSLVLGTNLNQGDCPGNSPWIRLTITVWSTYVHARRALGAVRTRKLCPERI